MKVKIGPYLNWWGPYQIAEFLLGNPRKNRWEMDYEPGWRERTAQRLGDWLAQTWVADFCQWIHDKRKRQVYVHIDNYDVWNMDSTLCHIIGPMFVKLKACKHGSGFVDDCDVPDQLRSTAPGARDGCQHEWDLDANFHHRYAWLLDELIWAFTTDHEAAKEPLYRLGPCKPAQSVVVESSGTEIDWSAIEAYDARLKRAYQLFGKYYQTFWD